jgi:predicted ester cyclase
MRNRIAIPLVMLAIGCGMIVGVPKGTTADQSRLSAGGSVMMAKEALEERGSRELVLRFYQELNQKPTAPSRAEHAVRVVERLFVPGYVGHGGPDNHDLDLDGWKNIIRSLYGRYPDLRSSVEDVITEGDKTLVRIRLRDGVNVVATYMALYRVEGGQIVERWAFGDRNFEGWTLGDRSSR